MKVVGEGSLLTEIVLLVQVPGQVKHLKTRWTYDMLKQTI
jgi:hypothetical protein